MKERAGGRGEGVRDEVLFCGWGDHKVLGASLWDRMGGFPGVKHESWKFTPLKGVGEDWVKSVYSESGLGEGREKGWGVSRYDERVREGGWTGVDVVNGVMRGGGEQVMRGVEVMGSGSGGAESLLKSYFGRVLDMRDCPFAVFNTMYTDDVLVIHVGEGVVVEEPIVLNMQTLGGHTVTSRVLFVLGEGSRCTLIEDFSEGFGGGVSRVVPVVETVLGAGSCCYHYKNQAMGAGDMHFATSAVTVEKGAKYERVVCQTGSLISRDELHIYVLGEGSEVNVGGVYIARGEQCLDQTVLLHHKVPEVVSRQEYRGVLSERSRGVFQGKIKVDKVAQKTDGYQANRTVLLSDEAWMHAKPELEIYADDVKCSHGAVVGELDKQAMYYLRSRGLSPVKARGLLLMAHVNEVLEGVTHEGVREDFRDFVGKILSEISL